MKIVNSISIIFIGIVIGIALSILFYLNFSIELSKYILVGTIVLAAICIFAIIIFFLLSIYLKRKISIKSENIFEALVLLKRKKDAYSEQDEQKIQGLVGYVISLISMARSFGFLFTVLTISVSSAVFVATLMQVQRLDTQNYLLESSRRSTLIFELNSILNNIDNEVSSLGDRQYRQFALTPNAYLRFGDKLPMGVEDHLKSFKKTRFENEDEFNVFLNNIFNEIEWDDKEEVENYKKLIRNKTAITITNLSNRLNGRIVALSRSLRPYRYLDDMGQLTPPISPERSQLLISLLASGIDLKDITIQGNFEKSDLRHADLSFSFLHSINLAGSDLSNTKIEETDFSDANPLASYIDENMGTGVLSTVINRKIANPSDLSGSTLTDSYIVNSNFREVVLVNANLSGSNLDGSNFANANLVKANLQNCIMRYTNFSEANLSSANLSGAILPEVQNLKQADLTDAILKGAFVPTKTWLDEVINSGALLQDKWVVSEKMIKIPNTVYEGFLVLEK